MTPRRLLAALMIALLGSGVFTFWISKKFAKPVQAAALTQKYVGAVKPLDSGATLQKTDLTLVDWPAGNKIEGAFARPEDIVGRTVLYPLAPGTPIIDRQLAVAGAGTGLSTKIPDGMRAISLKTDQVVGVAGFLLPGTHVDVLVTFRTQNTDPVTATVLQDAEIIAAGQKMQPDPEGKPTTVDVVTLLVKPNDAERVTLASAQGSVHFVLRNGSDHEQVQEDPAQLSELGGVKAPVKVAHAPAHKVDLSAKPVNQVYTVQTVSGGKQSTESFQ